MGPCRKSEKKGMTFEDHERIGQRLQALLHDLFLVGVSYNKSSKAKKLAMRTAKDIDMLRCELDNCAAAEYPVRERKERENGFRDGLYYGKGLIW
jgi:cob(I)alamin adenosyltransferase